MECGKRVVKRVVVKVEERVVVSSWILLRDMISLAFPLSFNIYIQHPRQIAVDVCVSNIEEERRDALITPPRPLPIHTTEPRHRNINHHLGFLPISLRLLSSLSTLDRERAFRGSSHGADYFRVSHFEVGGAVCGGLG